MRWYFKANGAVVNGNLFDETLFSDCAGAESKMKRKKDQRMERPKVYLAEEIPMYC